MQKQAPSLGRILVMVGFALSCFGLLLFLWLAFGGPIPLKPKGYRFEISFNEAGQLAQEADVRISGVSVGKVKAITTDKSTGSSDATIELEPRYAPIPKDTKAILRQKTLLGETYVELTPGDKSSGTVPEGGSLPAGSVSPTVELDEIFRAFDAKTRASFQVWMQQLALASLGRGRDISDAIGNLPAFEEDTTTLLKILNLQHDDVQAVVRDTGEVFSALSERDDQLRALIENSNRVFGTTARRNRQLEETFRALPTFERESKTTIARLTQFAHETNPLVTQLRPAARELGPTMVELSKLAPDLDGLFRALNPLIDASVKGLPASDAFLDDLHPLLASVDAPLRQLNPPLIGLSNYLPELGAFFANSAAATQATTQVGNKNVHYLRTSNPANPENLAVYQRRLSTNRPNPYTFPGVFAGLAAGLPAYETRQCTGGPSPTLAADPALIPPDLQANVQKFFFGPLTNGAVAAPPCRQQDKFPFGGEVTQYPHVNASTGPVARALARAATTRTR
ncbi:MAG TPA: MlaD family protein [Solirubrobacteraceae bacterium]|jgi:virulence factor Mce-like protein